MDIQTHHEALEIMERCGEDLLRAETDYKQAASKLHMLHSAGHGSDADREHAVDHLEDAGLIPRRKRDARGMIVG